MDNSYNLAPGVIFNKDGTSFRIHEVSLVKEGGYPIDNASNEELPNIIFGVDLANEEGNHV